jgi:hypothetical protein
MATAKSFSGAFPDSTEHTFYDLLIESENGEKYVAQELNGFLVQEIINLITEAQS